MAKRRRASVREALEAATSGVVVSQSSEPDQKELGVEEKMTQDAGSVKAKEEKTPTAKAGEKANMAKGSVGSSRKGTRKPRAKGHQKTSTGYLTSSGQEIVRLTLHLTPMQKRKLKIKSLEAGYENTSAFVVEALEL